MNVKIPPYDEKAVLCSYKNLQLLFNDNYNGDIYNVEKTPPLLICSSGPPLRKVKFKSEIQEDIEEKIPSFDGTLIRIFFHEDEWMFSTRKHIKAETASWPPSNKSIPFKETFEGFCKFEDIDIYLNVDISYTFLLLSNSIQNVLPNTKDEIFLISTFNRKEQTFQCKPSPVDRPPWANIIVKSSICGQYVINENKKDFILPRPQRGFLFYTTKGNIFQMDFQYYQRWEKIINNKPWQIIFYEMLKLQVTKKETSVSLQEFCKFYENNGVYDFNRQLDLLNTIADVIIRWDAETAELLKSNYLLNSIFQTVCAKNISELVPTHAFIVRQIAFMKYSFLNELFSKENMDILFSILTTTVIAVPSNEWETL
jgi:hypothetical protein